MFSVSVDNNTLFDASISSSERNSVFEEIILL